MQGTKLRFPGQKSDVSDAHLKDGQYRRIEITVIVIGLMGIAMIPVVRARTHSMDTGEPVRLPVTQFQRLLLSSRFIIGDENAAFNVVEFFDYECPPCRLLGPRVIDIVNSSKGKASLAIQNFPLNMHPHARALAKIASVLGGSEFEKFHSDALKLTGTDLDVLEAKWGEKLTISNKFWKLDANKKLEEANLAASHVQVDSTPSLFLIDRRKGIVYKCSTLGALEKAISKV